MLFREDFRARTLVPQEKAQELTENVAECGEKWRASFTKYDPDTCSWKTHQCSLLGDLDEFLETWPQWGLMRGGECWEQRTLEQTIRGTESGLSEKWATPTTMDKLPPKSQQALLKEATFARPGRNKPANLRDQVSNMQNWKICKERIPTPTARDGSGVRGKAAQERKGNPIDTVPIYVQKFPTPQASDNRDRGNMSNPSIQRRLAIGKQIMLSQSVDQTSGQLNPTWVEWLMGWPLGWTDLNPLETDKCHSVPLPLGES